MIPPRDLSLADVSVTWTLDGRTVSDGPAFTLETSDPAGVRATPLKLTATGTDGQGKDFSHALQVSFTALQIDKLASNRARAVFTMTQSFAAPNGERISGRLACELTLTRSDGRLRAERRAQGPCVPVP